jgi:hypothetical protein
VVGFPWVALYCGDASPWYGLYNIQTRKLRRFPCDALCRQDYDYSNLAAVGARWLEIQVQPPASCGDGVHYSCGLTTYDYYNIRTGKPQSPPVGKNTIIDLDSPTLTRPICPPLMGPALTFYGSFAVSQEPGGIYVERCGSDLNLPLVPDSIRRHLAGKRPRRCVLLLVKRATAGDLPAEPPPPNVHRAERAGWMRVDGTRSPPSVLR